MKKTIYIILGVAAVLVVAFFVFRTWTKSHSPEATAAYDKGGLAMTVHYCQPSKKGRVIFGEAATGALQPYGKYWRVGANEATTFEVNKDIIFGDKPLKAGKYSLYAYPDKDSWDIVLGKEWDRWGATEPEAKDEVIRVKALVNNQAPVKETLAVNFEETPALVLQWDQAEVKVPITVNQ